MTVSMYGKTLGLYCERGMQAGFWAEPLNAVSNLAFILASLALIMPSRQDGRRMSLVLTATVFIIGIGSFLFHSFATRWSAIADILPIFMFMLMAIGVMGSRALPVRHWALGGVLSLASFGLLIIITKLLSHVLVPLIGSSVSYLPALLVLLIGGIGLIAVGGDKQRKKAGTLLFISGLVFTLSMTARVIDSPFCEMWRIQNQQIGTHFLWHILNAITLYMTCLGLMALPSRTHNP